MAAAYLLAPDIWGKRTDVVFCTKIPYDSREMAMAMTRLSPRRISVANRPEIIGRSNKGLTAYICPSCTNWHVGHKR